MTIGLIPVKFKVTQTLVPFVYYIEQRYSSEDQQRWFISIPHDPCFDFHSVTFKHFKNGFDTPESALDELKKYLAATTLRD